MSGRSKIAMIKHKETTNVINKMKEDDPNKFFISYQPQANRMNGIKGKKEPPKPKTEEEEFEEIVNKYSVSIKKVRKFFHKYVERINEEEESKLDFKGYLKTEL